MRVARYSDVGHNDGTMRAGGRRLRPLARHGQNELVIALGRSNWLWLLAGSLRGQRAAIVRSLLHLA